MTVFVHCVSPLFLQSPGSPNLVHPKSRFMLVTRETSQALILPYFSSAVDLFWIQSPNAVSIEVELNVLPPV